MKNITTTCSLLLATSAAVAAQRPNVVIIMADDMGSGDASCYGSELINTPNIDMMASEGVRFSDYHSNGAVSSPTRAALMTGRYQQRCGVTAVISATKHRTELGLNVDEFTIAEAFKQMGYTTAMYGKWHLGYETKFNPIHHGFDYFEGYISGNVDYHSHIDQAFYADWWNGDKLVEEDGYSTDLITEKSVRFIAEHKDEPFFLYIPHEAPHYPLQGRNSKAERKVGGKITSSELDKETKQKLYTEMVEVMDEGVGAVIKALKDNGLDKNTLVVFVTDNGASSAGCNAPYRGRKSQVYEGGHRVPAVIWAPGFDIAPKIPYLCDQTILSMDLFPSLVAFAGGEAPSNLDGVDFLAPLSRGERIADRDTYLHHHAAKAVRRGEWKLIQLKEGEKPQLYNLSEDIAETTDVAEAHGELVESLMKSLEAWSNDVSK